jgi:hypothetical protein
MEIGKSGHVVKSFPTFPQIAGSVDKQIMKFMEDWLNDESEILTVVSVVPYQSNTVDGLEQMVLVVFEKNKK